MDKQIVETRESGFAWEITMGEASNRITLKGHAQTRKTMLKHLRDARKELIKILGGD